MLVLFGRNGQLNLTSLELVLWDERRGPANEHSLYIEEMDGLMLHLLAMQMSRATQSSGLSERQC